MKQFIEFIINHWILWSVFVLLVIVIIFDEVRGRVQGVPRLNPQDLTRLINREDAVIIDVRDANAFAKGHIIGAINIPHTQIDDQIDKIKKLQGKPIVLVCSNGQTAPQEGVKLRHKGIDNLFFLAGGLTTWQEAGLPLTRN